MAIQRRYITLGGLALAGAISAFSYRADIANKLGYGSAAVVSSSSTGSTPSPSGSPAPEPRDGYVDSFIEEMLAERGKYTAEADKIESDAKADIGYIISSQTGAYRADVKRKALERYTKESKEASDQLDEFGKRVRKALEGK